MNYDLWRSTIPCSISHSWRMAETGPGPRPGPMSVWLRTQSFQLQRFSFLPYFYHAFPDKRASQDCLFTNSKRLENRLVRVLASLTCALCLSGRKDGNPQWQSRSEIGPGEAATGKISSCAVRRECSVCGIPGGSAFVWTDQETGSLTRVDCRR